MVEVIFKQGDMSRVDEFMAPDFVEHEELPPGTPAGRVGVKKIMTMLHAAFPDFHANIDDLNAEDDKVVIRMTWTGANKCEFMGIPPTGKHVSFGVLDILRIVDGRAVEHWGQTDNMSLMQQLGVMPAPGSH